MAQVSTNPNTEHCYTQGSSIHSRLCGIISCQVSSFRQDSSPKFVSRLRCGATARCYFFQSRIFLVVLASTVTVGFAAPIGGLLSNKGTGLSATGVLSLRLVCLTYR
jgi:hypothetical protein